MSGIARRDSTEELLDAIETLNERVAAQSSATRGIIATIRSEREERMQLDRRVGRIEGQVGRGPDGWTVAAWLSVHGHKVNTDVIKYEGGVLRRICDARSIVVQPRKVCNGGEFAANVWPIAAIRIWWPDCARRYGWSEESKYL